ncbi:MAG TPA: biotin/lipoyl-binding protein, partial [Chloroflexi bacterium]|nr:biotin/lipoyl-binding protein [Chloroflexota bacterium]
MKRERMVPMLIIVAVLVIGVGAGFYLHNNPSLWKQVTMELTMAQPEVGKLTASGFIEAEEVSIAPELGGRVADLLVDEGDEVEAGQVLVRLDGTLLDARIEVAQAGLEAAEAGLAQAEAGARAERIRRAEAELSQAEAGRDGAYQAWQDLMALRDHPQELEAQIALARAQVAAAEAALNQAVAMKDAAEIADDAFGDSKAALSDAEDELAKIPEPYRPSLPGLPLSAHLIPNAYWKSWVGVNTAQAALDGARAGLNALYAMRDHPQELNVQVDA